MHCLHKMCRTRQSRTKSILVGSNNTVSNIYFDIWLGTICFITFHMIHVSDSVFNMYIVATFLQFSSDTEQYLTNVFLSIFFIKRTKPGKQKESGNFLPYAVFNITIETFFVQAGKKVRSKCLSATIVIVCRITCIRKTLYNDCIVVAKLAIIIRFCLFISLPSERIFSSDIILKRAASSTRILLGVWKTNKITHYIIQ